MPSKRVAMTIDMIGCPRYGEWCDSCQLPSAIRATALFTIEGRTTVQDYVFCTEAGNHWRFEEATA